jgi:hypothetical protein
MKMRFLLDEHLSLRLAAAVQHRNPLIDVLRVGDAGVPPLATPDPAILDYLAISQRALITRNRRSMIQHYGDHLAEGKTHWGIFVASQRLTTREIAEQIELLWEASEAEEWIDYLQPLPL